MKLLALPILIFLTSNVFANSNPIQFGCVKRVVLCDSTAKECLWSSKPGQIFSIELQRTGVGPSYEIWEGTADLSLENQPFHLKLYQRREANQNIDYLTIDLPIKGMVISGTGRELAQVLYFDETNLFGVGIRCTTAVSPTP